MTPLKQFLYTLSALTAVFQATVFGREDAVLPVDEPRAPALLSEVRSITLPHFEPEMAVAPGREEFLRVCVSCHSPRYVTMQPPFSLHQWEQTLDKMVKMFGAQMDDQQRQLIIGYLVAINGTDLKRSTAGGSARPEQLDSTSAANRLPHAERFPSLTWSTDPTEQSAEANRGRDLYRQHCIACHGTTGRGDGPVGPVLLRKPENLAANRFARQLLSQVLWNGKPGTAMPSWRGLSRSDLAALAVHVQTLHQSTHADPASVEIGQRGNRLFLQYCAPCHGESADGKGVAAANLFPAPANFKLKQPDLDYLLQILTDGIPGTAMPSWKEQVSEADRRALANFVRSLFEGTD